MRLLPTVVIALLAYSSSALASKCLTAADVYFSPGSSEIPVEQRGGINKAIERVKEDNSVLAVLPVGHSDSSEVPAEKQFELSVDRAKAVAEYVISVYPELKDIVHVEGKGATQPLSDKYPSQNRRVSMEVICVVKGPFSFPKSFPKR